MIVFRIIWFWLKRTELRLANDLLQFAGSGSGSTIGYGQTLRNIATKV